ncbi:TetR/AcrR family transcriptional regulator [Azospirillum canadense]|uniref:TetR/AcrR family transcriptional regulator n=1 Tax=Azospirillum canadense TaxID=403962 RepID=UPI002227A3D2|nr:TetR/AcrR family transcriptional regulator [Azospirillum canadense]MCW2241800.1 AcrR family transcriptional regulator [Azospirillum canadense]
MSGGRGRKRSETSRQAILEAAFALMQEDGFDHLSIEGVATRAGTGRTTIYRWWPSRGVLAVEAFLASTEPLIAFAHSGSARDDMVQQMRALAALYRGPTGRLVREMIGAAQHDQAMREAFSSGFLEPRREQARAVFRRGVAAGEFRTGIDADLAIDALYAPIYYRLFASGASIDDDFIARHAELVLRSIAPES